MWVERRISVRLRVELWSVQVNSDIYGSSFFVLPFLLLQRDRVARAWGLGLATFALIWILGHIPNLRNLHLEVNHHAGRLAIDIAR